MDWINTSRSGAMPASAPIQSAWRTVLAHGVKAALVHLPEKGWIWPWYFKQKIILTLALALNRTLTLTPTLTRYHKEIAEKQGSSRGIIMHKVTPELYPTVTVGEARWKLAEPAPRSIVDCSQRCSQRCSYRATHGRSH